MRYQHCEKKPEYYSWPQARATSLTFRTVKRPDSIQSDIHSGIGMDVLLRKYGKLLKGAPKTEAVAWVGTKKNKHVFQISSQGIQDIYVDSASLSAGNAGRKGSWLTNITEGFSVKGRYYEINAWQLTEDLRSIKLAGEYAAMVQFVDCLVDTSTTVMVTDRERLFVNTDTLYPEFRGWMKKTFGATVDLMDMSGQLRDSIWALPAFREELLARSEQVAKEALATINSTPELEAFLEPGGNAELIMNLKRSRVVWGMCSMDSRPREHARDIAVWAARAHDWPVFIRAHLNIMNDRFDRVSDGSYAQVGRKTYLRELEQLSIPSSTLLLGSIFRFQMPAPLHYYGAPGRIGRAFAESAERKIIEKALIRMMKDPELDDANRMMIFLTFSAYCYNQPDKKSAETLANRLSGDLTQFPEILKIPILELGEEIHKYGIAAD
ncbi:hypothetical protein [Chitinophaga caseinilytica]|uniref:Uncharacterized protein n=1 Tax=Chitinophaga caseinilytica TaxID=2267521 RepID=A0ABZ2Z580_9BACT